MEFLDSSGKIKGDTETSKGTTYSTWTYAKRENVKVPSGTRTIRVKMRSYRKSGDNNDGYFDDLSLKLYIPTDMWNGNWTGNKIQNPGAEDGLNHWHFPTLKSVSSPFTYSRDSDYFTKNDRSGSRFWAPGSEYIYAGAYQDVDVSDIAEAVDGGGSSNHDDVTLELDAAGWHAIGNPFVKEVNVADLVVNDGTVDRTFDDAVAAGLVEGTLYRWDGILSPQARLTRARIPSQIAIKRLRVVTN